MVDGMEPERSIYPFIVGSLGHIFCAQSGAMAVDMSGEGPQLHAKVCLAMNEAYSDGIIEGMSRAIEQIRNMQTEKP